MDLTRTLYDAISCTQGGVEHLLLFFFKINLESMGIDPYPPFLLQNLGSHSCELFVSALFFGLMTIALSYVAPLLGDELIQIPTTIWGVVGAPLLGLFVLAMFFPCANASVNFN